MYEQGFWRDASLREFDEVIVVRGLQAGDRVIVDGNIKARPGAPVKVVDPTAAGKPAAAPAKGA